MAKAETTKGEGKAFPDLSESELKAARKEGQIEAIKESAKAVFTSGAADEYGHEGNVARFQGPNDVAHIQDLVDLPVEELQNVLDGKHNRGPITEARVAGLLEVERSGKNRTDRVDLLCKHLGIDSPYEATAAGPAYTNDVSHLKAVKPAPEPTAHGHKAA
jgi:hypothetical protein